jgi:hypothetical protein
MSEHKNHSRIIIVIVLAALVLYIGGIAMNIHRDRTSRFINEGYSGKIFSITGNRLIINDVLGHREDILFASSTKVFDGRKSAPIEALHTGVFVIVSGTRTGGGPIQARTIRIMESPKGGGLLPR